MAPSIRRATASAVTLLVFAGVVALSGGARKGTRYVIIHSDDAGLCPSVNAATSDAMEKGSVSSASIMVPCPGFEEFATYAVAHPERDFGIHLTLNSEFAAGVRWGPVLPRQQVPSLVDSTGMLYRSIAETARNARLDEVELELRAQIERARARGIRLSHIDHHMFVLMARPDLFELYIKLALEYDLPVRIHRQVPNFPDEFVAWQPGDTKKRYQRGLDALAARKFPPFDFIDSENYDVDPGEKRAYYLKILRELKPGVSEILIHCAYDRAGKQRAPAAERRAADTRVFSSLEMGDELRALGIKLITWREFRRLAEHEQL